VLALCKPPQGQGIPTQPRSSCPWTSISFAKLCSTGSLDPLGSRTLTKHNSTVDSRSDRITRLDAETVASFVSFHAKSHVELLSESPITRGQNAAVSRANTEQRRSR
jgi:hypothetical protein